MKTVSILLAFSLSLLGIEDHDVAMATFRLSESGEGLELNISFDKDDYAEANKLTGQTIKASQFEDYLNTATCWTVNGKKLLIEVEKMTTKQHHVSAVCRIGGITLPVREMMVENEFLLDVEDQNNVVVLDLNGKSRGFRMHRGRREITVAY